MTVPELMWHLRKLNEKMKAEADARSAAMAQAQQKAEAAKWRARRR